MSQLFVYSYAIMQTLEMEKPMDNWNDDRLDELNRRVDEGFTKVDQRFERVEKEMKDGFAQVNRDMKEGFAQVDREMKEGAAELRGQMGNLAERFDRLQHTLVLASWGFVGTMAATLVAVLGAAVT